MAERVLCRAMICMCVMSDGDVKLRCTESIAWAIAEGAVDAAFFHEAYLYLDDGRNECVRRFLRRFEGFDRLLMVDADIEFAPGDIRRLVDDELPIISGVYHSAFAGRIAPVVFDRNDDGTFHPIREWPDGSLEDAFDGDDAVIEVTAMGAGFLMITREVAETLAEIHGEPCPVFAEEIRDGAHLGEDLTFCLRAAEAGIMPRVDRRVQVAHHKSVRLGGAPMQISLETNWNDQ